MDGSHWLLLSANIATTRSIAGHVFRLGKREIVSSQDLAPTGLLSKEGNQFPRSTSRKGRGAMLSAKQAAQRAGVSVSLIYAWCAAGILRHSRFGRPGRRGTIRVEEADLGSFLDNCRQEQRPAAAALPALKHITLPQLSEQPRACDPPCPQGGRNAGSPC